MATTFLNRSMRFASWLRLGKSGSAVRTMLLGPRAVSPRIKDGVEGEDAVPCTPAAAGGQWCSSGTAWNWGAAVPQSLIFARADAVAVHSPHMMSAESCARVQRFRRYPGPVTSSS